MGLLAGNFAFAAEPSPDKSSRNVAFSPGLALAPKHVTDSIQRGTQSVANLLRIV